ncbi:hypothetical protein K439DRAFT_1610456 [Ramaria rubella]|nr:hypothetical protein K439DRAFT_1610456 [Ramaria rubella]
MVEDIMAKFSNKIASLKATKTRTHKASKSKAEIECLTELQKSLEAGKSEGAPKRQISKMKNKGGAHLTKGKATLTPIEIRAMILIPEGLDNAYHANQSRGRLKITSTPEGAREGELEAVGLAVFGKKGVLKFFQEWSNLRIDEWLRDLFPEVFAFLDEAYPDPGPQRHWCLLKSSHNKLSKHKAIAEGLDLDEAKGVKGRPWSE